MRVRSRPRRFVAGIPRPIIGAGVRDVPDARQSIGGSNLLVPFPGLRQGRLLDQLLGHVVRVHPEFLRRVTRGDREEGRPRNRDPESGTGEAQRAPDSPVAHGEIRGIESIRHIQSQMGFLLERGGNEHPRTPRVEMYHHHSLLERRQQSLLLLWRLPIQWVLAVGSTPPQSTLYFETRFPLLDIGSPVLMRLSPAKPQL